jgi:hypothetical protein
MGEKCDLFCGGPLCSPRSEGVSELFRFSKGILLLLFSTVQQDKFSFLEYSASERFLRGQWSDN